jgi:hypothetical protein
MNNIELNQSLEYIEDILSNINKHFTPLIEEEEENKKKIKQDLDNINQELWLYFFIICYLQQKNYPNDHEYQSKLDDIYTNCTKQQELQQYITSLNLDPTDKNLNSILSDLNTKINFELSNYGLKIDTPEHLDHQDFSKNRLTHILGLKLHEGASLAANKYWANQELYKFTNSSYFEQLNNQEQASFTKISQLCKNFSPIDNATNIDNIPPSSQNIQIMGLLLQSDTRVKNHIVYVAIDTAKNELIITNRGYAANPAGESMVFKLKKDTNISDLTQQLSKLSAKYKPFDKLNNLLNTVCDNTQETKAIQLKKQKYGTCGYANWKGMLYTLLLREFNYDETKAKQVYKNFTNYSRLVNLEETLQKNYANNTELNEAIDTWASYIVHHHDINKPLEIESAKKIFNKINQLNKNDMFDAKIKALINKDFSTKSPEIRDNILVDTNNLRNSGNIKKKFSK